ncbi:four helix bundle protein [Gelidibacter sediminis]|uniref:Four helix bundle protein n=1 Tax=Gelidibacter sediminis TaxID=1608710 RepID=A0A4R7Q7S3_9FLAO|nr:four helix bundle protein [Gelidibacter sediminis]
MTFEFSLKIIALSEELRAIHKYEMASQIFRSGTSIGANIMEAQNAESKADFIYKFKRSAKESDEFHYWLKLCEASDLHPNPSKEVHSELRSISLIISKIISSSKKG